MPAYRPQAQYSYAQYPNLIEVLAPEYATLPPAEIEALMEGMFGPGAAEYYEDYLEGIFDDIGKAFSSVARDVGKFAVKAAPAIATVGGGALQGALAGSSLGLPGIIAGAAAGGTGAALSTYGKGTARDIGGALSGLTGLAGQFSPWGRLGGAIAPAISGLAGSGGKGAAGAAVNVLGGLLGGGSGGSAVNTLGSLLGGGGGSTSGALGSLTSLFGGRSAIGQLLSFLQRPEAMQALAALNLSAASPPGQPIGRRTIPVGSARTPVPTSAIAGVIGELVEQAVAEAAALSDGAESEPRYMMDEAGEFVGDPALDRDRAARVWELLNEAQAERLVNAVAVYEQVDEAYDDAESYMDSEAQEVEFYDAIDLAEIYTIPTEDLDEVFLEYDGEDLIEDYGEEEDESEYYESEY